MESKTIQTKDCLKALLHFMKPYRLKLIVVVIRSI